MENPTLPTNWLAALSNANHVRKQKIGQNSLTSLRPAPSAPDFQALQRAFLCRFPYLCQTKLINNEEYETLQTIPAPAGHMSDLSPGSLLQPPHRVRTATATSHQQSHCHHRKDKPFHSYTRKLFSSSRNSYIFIYTMPSLS